jgi:hypothetical protein
LLLLAELGFEVVEEGHEVVDLGDDAFLLGQGRSHPAAVNAGVMNLVQMSRSDRSFLFTVCPPARRHGTADRGGWRGIHQAGIHQAARRPTSRRTPKAVATRSSMSSVGL